MNEINEEELFVILSHPLRRRILKTIYAMGKLSFKTISEEWGIKTGTLYFHLNELKKLISQNQQKQYILLPNGVLVCNWFVDNSSGIAHVKKISSFTLLGYPILSRIQNNAFWRTAIILVAFIAFFVSERVDLRIVGMILIPDTNSSRSSIILGNILFVIFLFLISYSLGKFSNISIYNNISTVPLFLFTLLTSYILIIGLVLITFFMNLKISLFTWIIFNILTQMSNFMLSTTVWMIEGNLKIDRALLFTMISVYCSLLLSILLS